MDVGEAGARTRVIVIGSLLIISSGMTTAVLCVSMSTMGAMPMPGGWTMSMAWMRLPGHSWAVSAVAFTGMWTVMTIAMMLPSLTPGLLRCLTGSRHDRSVAVALTFLALGYFAVWTLLGLVLYPIGALLASLTMEAPSFSRIVPQLTGAVVLGAGLFQLTSWKARQLACCRTWPDRQAQNHDRWRAWRKGVRLGTRCVGCCAGSTGVLLVLGVMDLRVMAAVTAAITLERVVPQGTRAAVASGVAAIAVGVGLLARATGFV